MHALLAESDEMLLSALRLADQGEATLHEALESLPAPIYTTDTDGFVTFFNTACVGFAGRRPSVGKDRWCVTWKLYTEAGEFLPHDQCPMAMAIASRDPIRGVCAVAERPDGTRVTFTPFPTPMLDKDGVLIGAINLLLDLTEIRQIAELQSQAQRCRRLMSGVTDSFTIEALRTFAEECETKAAELEADLPRFHTPIAA
jgi:PAS domain-containing protein